MSLADACVLQMLEDLIFRRDFQDYGAIMALLLTPNTVLGAKD
jgi:hypothetical protein